MLNSALAGFTLGLISSLHCTAMCGPLMMLLPQNKNLLLKQFFHHFGRVLTYILIAIAFYSLGQLFSFSKLQNKLSYSLGALIILFIIIPPSKLDAILKKLGWYQYTQSLNRLWKKSSQSTSIHKNIFTGMIHGLLPCGLVYLAASTALLQNNLTSAIIFMLCFGFGTTPSLITIVGFKTSLHKFLKPYSQSIIKYSMLCMGILMILRGLQLNIPYLSPTQIESKPCCEVTLK